MRAVGIIPEGEGYTQDRAVSLLQRAADQGPMTVDWEIVEVDLRAVEDGQYVFAHVRDVSELESRRQAPEELQGVAPDLMEADSPDEDTDDAWDPVT